MRKHIWNDYKEWLLDSIGFEKRGYDILMEQLHATPFTYSIPMDKNRENDGLYLRLDFCKEKGLNPHSLDFYEECSVLEMLVALSIRIENEYIGDPMNLHPEEFFWKMLQNLELDRENNRKIEGGRVGSILRTWLDREFKWNGVGSPFPIGQKWKKTDQRKLQIWDQAMEYIADS